MSVLLASTKIGDAESDITTHNRAHHDRCCQTIGNLSTVDISNNRGDKPLRAPKSHNCNRYTPLPTSQTLGQLRSESDITGMIVVPYLVPSTPLCPDMRLCVRYASLVPYCVHQGGNEACARCVRFGAI